MENQLPDSPERGVGGPPSLQLNVLSSIFLSIRQWSVPISLSEIAVEGRASTNRFQPILEGLRLVE